jgi:hypothetical protein
MALNNVRRALVVMILLLLLSVATGTVAEQICTIQKAGTVAQSYADILPVLRPPTQSNSEFVENVFAMSRLMQQGRLTRLPKGTPVEVRGSPLANGAVQIRLPGTSQEFWTTTEFLDCAR